MTSDRGTGVVIFSGGSAANNLVDVFREVTEEKKRPLSYVIPISDNGGSSSELIRVFGGPGEYLYMPKLDKLNSTNLVQGSEIFEVRILSTPCGYDHY